MNDAVVRTVLVRYWSMIEIERARAFNERHAQRHYGSLSSIGKRTLSPTFISESCKVCPTNCVRSNDKVVCLRRRAGGVGRSSAAHNSVDITGSRSERQAPDIDKIVAGRRGRGHLGGTIRCRCLVLRSLRLLRSFLRGTRTPAPIRHPAHLDGASALSSDVRAASQPRSQPGNFSASCNV